MEGVAYAGAYASGPANVSECRYEDMKQVQSQKRDFSATSPQRKIIRPVSEQMSPEARILLDGMDSRLDQKGRCQGLEEEERSENWAVSV